MRFLSIAACAALLAGCGDDDASDGRGGLCGDPRLKGEVVGRVPGELPACGIDDAVRLTSVSGVTLSQGALVDCPTARRFADWVDRGAKPAIGNHGGGIESLQIAAHYVCRSRNHLVGAPVSEHGKGKAIDISGITLADGESMTVLNDWGRGRHGRSLARMHGAACGPFGTVLGPGSDALHRDHFHFDTARHGNGAYCR
ncbi:extensin family protein [Citreimonas salinaria]|uniref:Extensin-like protein C-terminus n=1 Tax=Citreimonas salinaria TaxID=321339 RepID=A0A1H3F6I2_9RHOB|nr:extensin family protein [Citreimonas salinaria]SDX86596.1 Extensin-like protein C-terminus [Citreimonas salinaria]